MRITIGNRGSGISTNLLLESAAFNVPIMCASNSTKTLIKSRAEYLDIDIPEPISINDNVRGVALDKVLIDNLDLVLKELLAQKGFRINKIANAGISIDQEVV